MYFSFVSYFFTTKISLTSLSFTHSFIPFRSGTVPTPLVVGFGEACKIAQQEMEYDHAWVTKLSNLLVESITSRSSHIFRNGDPEHSYPGCVNLSFAYVEGRCCGILCVCVCVCGFKASYLSPISYLLSIFHIT